MPRIKLTVSAKLAALAFCFVATVTAPQAAEYSTGNSLGFSSNGGHFVFEEYGIADGIGTPYVNLFAIDIVRDRWLKGTPVRLKGTEEQAIALEEKLANQGITNPQQIAAQFRLAAEDLRKQAVEKAAPALKPLGTLSPADLRVHNPPHEFTSDGQQVRFSPIGYRNQINSDLSQNVWRLEVAQKSFPASESCFGRYETMNGFSLLLINEANGEELMLNNDNRIPKSRGCPQKYYVEQVSTYPRANNGFSLAVLMRYSLPGFEGPDGRLLAVTTIVDMNK
ncbi:MAG: DUF2259 domain-containing protein [Rhizobiaceae bacterium]